MKNIKSFKKLRDKYSNLTIEDFRDYLGGAYNGQELLENVTGFGSDSCTLCIEANRLAYEDGVDLFYYGSRCEYCVWGSDYSCFNDEQQESYDMIDAFNEDENYIRESDIGVFISIVKDRIKLMDAKIKEYENN